MDRGALHMNQNSDSPQITPTVELMRQRRDAWRARYTEEHARYLFEHEKVLRLERELEIVEADRELLKIMRQQYRLLHGRWLDTRAQQFKANEQITDYENRITWYTTCQRCANLLDRSIADYERAERAEAEVKQLRELIADQIGEMGQEIERKLPRSLGMGRGPADLSQRAADDQAS